MTYEEMHAVAQYLYQLLDDIDTATDIAKSDDKLYRGIVERTQAKKAHVVAECDGYTVTLRPLTANDRVEGRDAALSRRVPSHDGLCVENKICE